LRIIKYIHSIPNIQLKKKKDGTVARTSGIDTCRGKRLEGGAEKTVCLKLPNIFTFSIPTFIFLLNKIKDSTVPQPPAEKGRGKRLKGGGGKPVSGKLPNRLTFITIFLY